MIRKRTIVGTGNKIHRYDNEATGNCLLCATFSAGSGAVLMFFTLLLERTGENSKNRSDPGVQRRRERKCLVNVF